MKRRDKYTILERACAIFLAFFVILSTMGFTQISASSSSQSAAEAETSVDTSEEYSLIQSDASLTDGELKSASQDPTNLTVSTYDELKSSIENAHNDMNISITGDIQLASSIFIGSGVSITLSGSGNSILQSTADNHFVIYGRLILNNVTLDNNGTGGGINVYEGGSLTLSTGAIIQNCSGANLMGVHVFSGGSLIMEDGSAIKNCTSLSGSGVYVEEGGSFVMDGGAVINNKSSNGGGSGVYVLGSFVMNGGIISGNITQSQYSDGAGIAVANGGKFEMYGGTISENECTYNGGGVYVGKESSFHMYGGDITGNQSQNGGGIYADNATVNIDSGNICNNTAEESGGGIYNDGMLSIKDSAISGNNSSNGGGIYVSHNGQLTVSDECSITDNSACNSGGGIYTEDYEKTATCETVVFNGNTASLAYEPPTDTSDYSQICYASSSIVIGKSYISPLNNYDINYDENEILKIYNVVYTPNGGVGNEYSEALRVNTTHNVISNECLGYTYDGYTFLGWSTSPIETDTLYTVDSTQAIGGTAQAGDTITLYAVWQENAYTVTYNPNDGNGSEFSETIDIGFSHVVLSNDSLNYTRNGYIFLGWSTDPAEAEPIYTGDGTEAVGDLAKPGDTITLFAVWQRGSYTVTYNPNGGIGREFSQDLWLDTLHTVQSNDIFGYYREGYTFLGWSTDPHAGEAMYTFNNTDTVVDTANNGDTIILYAVWQQNNTDLSNTSLFTTWLSTTSTYTVSFNSNGGSSVNSQTLSDGDKIIKPNDPARDGYTFDGWYTDNGTFNSIWDFDSGTVSSDTTLYAKWLANPTTYTVSFNSTGGSSISDQTVISGEKATKPENPTRNGYTFDGWYTDNGVFENAWSFDSDSVSGDTILYAKWLTNYTVCFDSNGGSSVDNQTVVTGSKISKPLPTRDGYTLDGWYTDNDTFDNMWNFDSDTVSSNITLYAKWTSDGTLSTSSNSSGAATGDQSLPLPLLLALAFVSFTTMTIILKCKYGKSYSNYR